MKVLVVGAAIRDRRKSRGEGMAARSVWVSVQLRDWISAARPALVEVIGSRSFAEQSRDFALDMIQLAQSAELAVVWHLRPPSSMGSGTSMQARDVIRSLVRQTTASYHEQLSDSDLDERMIAMCATDEEWLSLFVHILSFLPRVAVVIDAYDNSHQMLSMVKDFWDILNRTQIDTVIKMLVLTYPTPGSDGLSMTKSSEVAYYKVNLGQDRKPGTSRISQLQRGRGSRQAASRGSSKLEKFRLLMK